MNKPLQDLIPQAGLGAISGLRSMSGPAAVARAARDGRISLGGTRLAFLGSPWVAAALTALQAGEMIGDKLPSVPGRTAPGPLLGRLGSGALVGTAVSASEGHRVLTGSLVGAGTAVAAAFAGEQLRAVIGGKTGVPDALVALAEDAVVLAVTASLLRQG